MSTKNFNNDDILYIVEKVIKMLSNGNVFENDVSNYYHLRPQIWHMSMKKFY